MQVCWNREDRLSGGTVWSGPPESGERKIGGCAADGKARQAGCSWGEGSGDLMRDM